jgi:hypothetical protein
MGALFEKPAFLILMLLFFAIPVALLIWLVVFLSKRNRRQMELAHAAQQAAPQVAAAQTTGPGWYPQPDGSQRYWDGKAWTEHTAP